MINLWDRITIFAKLILVITLTIRGISTCDVAIHLLLLHPLHHTICKASCACPNQQGLYPCLLLHVLAHASSRLWMVTISAIGTICCICCRLQSHAVLQMVGWVHKWCNFRTLEKVRHCRILRDTSCVFMMLFAATGSHQRLL